MMKYLNKIILLFVLTVSFIACEKNENFEIGQAQEEFQITTPSNGSVIVLSDVNLENQGLFISWDTMENIVAPFTIEVALTGTNFETPYQLGTSESKNFTITVEALNTFLLDVMDLDPEEANSIDVRVLSNEEITQTVSVVLTPYKVEFDTFFLVGSLTNWAPEEALEMTRLDVNIFEITLDLAADDEFKFLPTNASFDGDWGRDPENEGALIVDGEDNLKGFEAGKYKITVDLNTFTYTVEQITAPENLFIVGSFTNWKAEEALEMNLVAEGVYNLVIDLNDSDEFKFLPTNTSFDGDWGNNPEATGSLIQDGEENLKGYAAGTYMVQLDFNLLTFTVTPLNSLFVVGSITGWDPSISIEMGVASTGIFSTIVDLPDGAEFKFLPTNSSFDGDWGNNKDNTGSLIQDGEENLKGYEAGKYIIAVNFNNLTFTVSKISDIPSTLFLVGSFFNDWSNTAENPEFTESSTGVFEITQDLSADDEFKFVPVAGEWGNDFGESKLAKGVLEQNEENNLKASETGTYKITVDFNNGTISTVLQ